MKTIGRDMIEILQRGLNLSSPLSNGIVSYITSLQNPDGGFRGRTSESDLYYTVFGTDILSAAGMDWNRDKLIGYLSAMEPEKLDFIHLCCWIRCAARVPIIDKHFKRCLVRRLNSFLCEDGLFHHVRAGRDASVYGTFMAFSAAQKSPGWLTAWNITQTSPNSPSK